MLFTTRPEINLFAGWNYLLSRRFRQEVRDQWQTLPGWAVAIQVAVGACSVLFPLIIVGLLAYVFIVRQL